MNLSVVLPAFGRDDILIRCLTALDRDARATGIECELCVIDDGSDINEATVRAAADISLPLLWHAFKTSRGRSAARNTGVALSSNDIIIFLDADMEIQPGFLSAHLSAHLTHPDTGVIGHIIWPDSGSFLRYIGSRGIAKLTPGDQVPPWYFVTGNASIERKDLPEKPFDESLPGWGGEDLDLGMKLDAGGIRFISAPEARSFHHFDGTLKGHITRTEEYGKSALPVLVRRFPEITEITRLNLLQSAFWRFMVSKGAAFPAELFALAFDVLPLPMRLFDYLTFAAYSRGYLKGVKS